MVISSTAILFNGSSPLYSLVWNLLSARTERFMRPENDFNISVSIGVEFRSDTSLQQFASKLQNFSKYPHYF
jgi:hypothetical protein